MNKSASIETNHDNRLEWRLKIYSALAFFAALAVCAACAAAAWQAVLLYEQKEAETIATAQSSVLQEHLNRSLSATYAVASVLRHGKGHIPHFDTLAQEMLQLYSGISSLQLAKGGVITEVVPLAGNEKAIGHNLLQDPARNREAFLAIDTHKLTLAGPFELVQGGLAVIGRLPVFLPDQFGADQFWGFTTALIRIPEFLAMSNLPRLAESGYDYQLSYLHPTSGKAVVFASSVASALRQPVVHAIDVPNGKWFLSIAPLHGWVHPSLFAAAAIVALLIATFVASVTRTVLQQPILLRREVAARTDELAHTNRGLKLEIVERERTQQSAAQISRLHSMLSHTNSRIARITDRHKLLQEICHVTMEYGGFPLAKIALLDAENDALHWVSKSGQHAVLAECEGERGCALAAQSVAGRHMIVCSRVQSESEPTSPICRQALTAGFSSHAMFQLKAGERVAGIFSLYAYEANFFDAEQLRLLQEMADDISFALENIEHETRRVKHEQSLQKLSRAVEQTANAVLITDRDGVIEYINPWFTKMTGYTPDELVGRTPRMLKSHLTSRETHKALWDTLLSGKEWHGKLHNIKKNGEPYWCLEAISPLKNEAGDVTHFVAITEDSSERQQSAGA
ncbi:MAG: PAS domain S-box protein [Burkholderiaceae bacterium]|nr:PAS domain S-box protein [Burkholderiaceae bacterium]